MSGRLSDRLMALVEAKVVLPDWVDDAFKKSLKRAVNMMADQISSDMPKGKMSSQDVTDFFHNHTTGLGPQEKETHDKFVKLSVDQAWKLMKELFPKGIMFYGAEW